MATAISLSFPWGRYHATPWGRHVNEAAVEWPPSPWRLLRAVYATWASRCPHLDAGVVEPLLAALCEPPSFVLPTAVSEGHTRHYVPAIDHLRDVRTSTDKAIDAFAVLAPGAEVVVRWEVDLAAGQRSALAELATMLPYVGRAESVCDARLLNPGAEPVGAECRPLSEPVGDPAAPPVRVLVPKSPLDLDALAVRTSDLRGGGRIDPEGARWVLYERPSRDEPRRARPRRPSPRVTAVRWAVTAPALPSKYAAVTMTHFLRRACLSQYERLHRKADPPVLAGKDGPERLSDHRHAHYLALDIDGDQLIDHLALWAPAGLAPPVLAAVVEVTRLWAHDFVPDFRRVELGVEAVGDVETVLPELCGPAVEWKSLTPFAPARHAKRQTWPEHLAASVAQELRWRGTLGPSDEPPEVVALPTGDSLRYRRHRPNKQRLADARRASALRLRFAEPVGGPFALGALSHFGLGLFRPVG